MRVNFFRIRYQLGRQSTVIERWLLDDTIEVLNQTNSEAFANSESSSYDRQYIFLSKFELHFDYLKYRILSEMPFQLDLGSTIQRYF